MSEARRGPASSQATRIPQRVQVQRRQARNRRRRTRGRRPQAPQRPARASPTQDQAPQRSVQVRRRRPQARQRPAQALRRRLPNRQGRAQIPQGQTETPRRCRQVPQRRRQTPSPAPSPFRRRFRLRSLRIRTHPQRAQIRRLRQTAAKRPMRPIERRGAQSSQLRRRLRPNRIREPPPSGNRPPESGSVQSQQPENRRARGHSGPAPASYRLFPLRAVADAAAMPRRQVRKQRAARRSNA